MMEEARRITAGLAPRRGVERAVPNTPVGLKRGEQFLGSKRGGKRRTAKRRQLKRRTHKKH
jgi:hypothetical protein